MRMLVFLSALFFATGAAATALGADLAKIDRTIAKEPAYKSKPKYCLLVFGPEATTRVWLALDGDVLYVDRNGNGNLTEEDERIDPDRSNPPVTVFLVGAISTPEEKLRYTDLRLSLLGAAGDSTSLSITIAGGRWYVPVLQFSARPKDAPIIHLGGPLSFRIGEERSGEQPTLVRGKKTRLVIYVGTRGLGSFAWCKASEVVPAFSLQVQIEVPNSTPGGKPLITRVMIHPPDV
jgi:hypothetical protein